MSAATAPKSAEPGGANDRAVAAAAATKVGRWLGRVILLAVALVTMPGHAQASSYPPVTDPPDNEMYFYTEEGTCSYGDDGVLTGGNDPLIVGFFEAGHDLQATITVSALADPASGASGRIVLFGETIEVDRYSGGRYRWGDTHAKWDYTPGQYQLDTLRADAVAVQSGQTAKPLKLYCPLNDPNFVSTPEKQPGDDNGSNDNKNNGSAAALPNTGLRDVRLGVVALALVGLGSMLVGLSRRHGKPV